jgi:hypothetical protein
LNTPATAGRAKYQHMGDRKSIKTWGEGEFDLIVSATWSELGLTSTLLTAELSALHAEMFAILKQNVARLRAIPEVRRTSSV